MVFVAEHEAPAAWHPLPSQHPLFWHCAPPPVQQAPPATPHVQVPVTQMSPFMHALLFATHFVFVSQHPPLVQVLPGMQQAEPAAPHGGTHVPFVHTPAPLAHIPLFATHLPVESQQPPFAQTLPGQHACVGPPHVWQVPLTHVSPAVEQGIPLPTHVFPAPGSQHPPPLQTLPAQHAVSAAPHVWHALSVALLHTSLGIEHALPLA
jgi:hypothetical protein